MCTTASPHHVLTVQCLILGWIKSYCRFEEMPVPCQAVTWCTYVMKKKKSNTWPKNLYSLVGINRNTCHHDLLENFLLSKCRDEKYIIQVLLRFFFQKKFITSTRENCAMEVWNKKNGKISVFERMAIFWFQQFKKWRLCLKNKACVGKLLTANSEAVC